MQQESRHLGEVTWRYSAGELWADGAVHVVGLILAAAGTVVFAVFLLNAGDPAYAAAVALYLSTLMISISASAVYNIWPVSKTKWWLRRIDHSAIYLLIAGTYTPFMVKMSTWWMLSGVWAIAIAGVGLKLLRPGQYDRLSIALYLGMGWSGVATYDSLVGRLSPTVIWLIVAGGLVYSLGVIFHLWENLRFQNAIWHGFVLVAAAIHYAAVWCATLT